MDPTRMHILSAIVLGIVQGATEFLPVSSSAHLILVPWVLGWEPHGLVFDVALHLGTSAAVLLYFWREWVDLGRELFRGAVERAPFGNDQRRMAWFLAIGTIPAMIAGLAMEDYVETHLRSPLIPAVTLVIFALVLFLAERKGKQNRNLKELAWADCLWIGASQALALIPGVSRSGITISTALIRDVNRAAAARFSFLLSTPIIVGAGILQGWHLGKEVLRSGGSAAGNGAGPVEFQWIVLAVGLITAAVTGFLCIRYFLRYLQTHTFTPFVVYRIILAALILVFYLENS